MTDCLMRVLIAGGQGAWAGLEEQLPGWQLDVCPPQQLADRLDGVDVVCPLLARVDAAMVNRGTFGLVQQFGVGLDTVDVTAASAAGAWVARLPADLTGNADSVAELAMVSMLTAVRRVDEARAALQAGSWGQPISGTLLGSTVLLVGLGATGTAVARRLSGFGVRLLGVRAHPHRGAPADLADAFAEVGGPADLRRLLGEADVVVCCAALDANSRGLFDAAAFAAVKPGVIFVNVGRGGLVDEAALVAALDDGRVGAAAVDVYTSEPAGPDHPLVRHPRVIATPHIAGVTSTMLRRAGALFADNLRRWASGQPPRWAVNTPPCPR